MGFAAVYLDHHWVLDAVAGIVYTTVVFTVVRVYTRVRAARPVDPSGLSSHGTRPSAL